MKSEERINVVIWIILDDYRYIYIYSVYIHRYAPIYI